MTRKPTRCMLTSMSTTVDMGVYVTAWGGINHFDQMSNASSVLSSSTAVSPYHYDQISQRSQCFTLKVSSEWASLVQVQDHRFNWLRNHLVVSPQIVNFCRWAQEHKICSWLDNCKVILWLLGLVGWHTNTQSGRLPSENQLLLFL